MKLLVYVALTFLACQLYVNAVNILYLSNIPSPSHFIWCKSILLSLHQRGHNITALSPDVEKSTANFTYYHLENVYPLVYNGTTEMKFFEMGQSSYVQQFLDFTEFIKNACVGSLNSKGYQQILDFPDDFKFDLVIYDFTMSQCLLGIIHKFKYPPTVSVSPFMFSGKSAQLSGSLLFPAFSPSPDTAMSQKMNFQQRFETFFKIIFEIGFDAFYLMPQINGLVQQKHPGIPHIDDIERKATKIIMLNTQPISDHKQPTFSNVKLVGGVQIKKPKELPAEIKADADASKNGLVLFSLGTNVRSDTLGDERIVKIIKAFERLPTYTFFWKFETKEKLPIELPKNVKIQSWMPQNDILAHPNMKLFISHCGLLSTQEALWYGVPVLGFPVFADQPHNAFRMKEMGVSETLSILDFTEDELYETVKKLLEDSNYQKNIKTISAALRDQPMTPIEEATYWAEWILRHPDIDLSSPTVGMSLFVRHSLDIFTVIFVLVFVAFLLWAKFIGFVIRMCSSDKKSMIDKSKKRN